MPGGPKKKKTGMIIGIIAGAGVIVSGVIFAILLATGTISFGDNSNNSNNGNNGSSGAASQAPNYTNADMGLAFYVPSNWYTSESTNMPDEVMEVLPNDNIDIGQFIWIDRFYDRTVAEYKSASNFLTLYAYGTDGEGVNALSSVSSVIINGHSWDVVEFSATNGTQTDYGRLYMTDMPNNQGLLLVALLIPWDDTSVVLQSSDFMPLETIMSSLQFTN
jgi:hypothetical protein